MQLPHLHWAHLLPLPLHSPLPHKEDGRGRRGGAGCCKRAHPHFTEKQVAASEVTGPTWFGSQRVKYGHQDTRWTMQSFSIKDAHTSPSLAFTHTLRSTHVPPPPTPLTFSTVFCLCLISWWPSVGRVALPVRSDGHTTARELALLHLVQGMEGRISDNTLITQLVVAH